ncbi:MAG: DUF4864 domain-containing protein, partial [Pseudomonadota bacterium]
HSGPARRRSAPPFCPATTPLLIASVSAGFTDPATDSRVVIERQLERFAVDDWTGAFNFAAPSIQEMFRTPQRFGEMVRNGYPMVWRPGEVTFLGNRQDELGRMWQRLRMTDRDGVAYRVTYVLEEVGSTWRIAGVYVEREPQAGA